MPTARPPLLLGGVGLRRRTAARSWGRRGQRCPRAVAVRFVRQQAPPPCGEQLQHLGDVAIVGPAARAPWHLAGVRYVLVSGSATVAVGGRGHRGGSAVHWPSPHGGMGRVIRLLRDVKRNRTRRRTWSSKSVRSSNARVRSAGWYGTEPAQATSRRSGRWRLSVNLQQGQSVDEVHQVGSLPVETLKSSHRELSRLVTAELAPYRRPTGPTRWGGQSLGREAWFASWDDCPGVRWTHVPQLRG